MSDPISLLAARKKLYYDPYELSAYLAYVRQHSIDLKALFGFAGACVVRNIVDCGNLRFEFAYREEDEFPAFVCEAFGNDGETVIDLVAWPLDRPNHVMTMFGRCGLLGAWEAMNPATYIFDAPLIIHKTPLDWLKADCRGAAVVTPHVAARMLLDLPGRIAAQDEVHGQELERLRRSVLPANQILVPSCKGGLAA